MTTFDLAIRGGTIVNADSMATADIGIADGIVRQIGGDMQAAAEIDARGKLLVPGGIDAHVHVSSPPGHTQEPRWVDDFTSGSAAALAGGITTIGNMTFLAPGEMPLAGLERESSVARDAAIADYFLHPVLDDITPETLDEIPRLLDHGCNTVKVFMVFPGFDAHVADYVSAIRLAGASGLLTMIHCEDTALIGDARSQLVRVGNTSMRFYAESSPTVVEVVAVQRAAAIARATGAPIYVVHLSSAEALAACADARSRGLPVFVETRPLYLFLTRERFEEEGGGKYAGQPPLREQSDVDALWHGIAAGTVHTVCSDHAPWTLAAKLDPAVSIENLRAGVENLQTLRPMLYSEGVRTGRITLSRFVEVTATNAAKLFGLFPRKGTIAVGSDADIAVWDPELTRTIDGAMLKSNADYSVYEGWPVTGWPVLTLRRGEIVFQDDEVTGKPGSGLEVPRSATARL